jgi:hypothetical protein
MLTIPTISTTTTATATIMLTMPTIATTTTATATLHHAPADISKKLFIHIHTNFLRLYRKTPVSPQKDQVSKTLPPSQQTIFENCVAHQNGHVGKACVRMWTHQECKPYEKINNALLTDHSAELQNWMHFIRAFNHYLVHSWVTPLELVTYRGSRLSVEDLDRLITGKWYRISMYAATSTDKSTAQEFNQGVKFEFHIPAGCLQACKVAELSEFEDENEVLLVPYSPIRIRSIQAIQNEVWVVVDVARDSKGHDYNQQSTTV